MKIITSWRCKRNRTQPSRCIIHALFDTCNQRGICQTWNSFPSIYTNPVHTLVLSLSPSLFLSLAPCAEASDRRCWVSARSVKMASKGRWKGRARFTAMRDALIFIYGNRLYARNHPRPIYSGGDGGSGGGCTRENPYALVWSKLGYSSDITHPPST